MVGGGVKWEDLNPTGAHEGAASAENGEKGSTMGSSCGAGDIEMKGIGDERQAIEVTSTRGRRRWGKEEEEQQTPTQISAMQHDNVFVTRYVIKTLLRHLHQPTFS